MVFSNTYFNSQPTRNRYVNEKKYRKQELKSKDPKDGSFRKLSYFSILSQCVQCIRFTIWNSTGFYNL